MRQKIIHAMYESVAKQGYDKTSLSHIAQAVAIQKPSLYYYFKSKEEMFLATIQEHYEQLFPMPQSKIEHFQTKEDFRSFFYHMGLSYLKPFEQDSMMQQFYCEVNLQSLRLPLLIAYFEQNDQQCQEEMEYFFRLAQEKNIFPPEFPIKTQVNMTLALVIGLSEMILYHMKGDFKQVWEQYVNGLFEK